MVWWFKKDIFFYWLILFNQATIFSSLTYVWYIVVSLIDSCSISWKSYPLSRHRFCFCEEDILLFLFAKIPSIVFVAAFISCVLTAVINNNRQIDNGIPFLSVNTWRFVPSLPLSVGFGPVMSPPKGAFIDTLSSDCQIQLIPYLWDHHIYFQQPNPQFLKYFRHCPFLKSSMTCRTRTILLLWKHLPLTSRS